MFYTKKVVTLSLLLTGVIGTSFGSEAAASQPKVFPPISRASVWSFCDKSSPVRTAGPQIFKTFESLIKTCRPHYEETGTLNDSLTASVRAFTKNPSMTTEEAINFILSMHPESPELRSPSRVSPAAVTPRDAIVMSPLTLMGSISPDTIKQ